MEKSFNSESFLDKIDRPCVILAGAGTGKTTAIVSKITYLIKNKVFAPERLVCITFSNEAANNLIIRTRNELLSAEEPVVKTFHSFSAMLLKEEGSKIGIRKDFEIIEPDDIKIMLHSNLKIKASDCHRYASAIGRAKDLGFSFEKFENFLNNRNSGDLDYLAKEFEKMKLEAYTDPSKLKDRSKIEAIEEMKNLVEMKKFCNAWKSYEKLKIANNQLDYADLNYLALELVSRFPKLSEKYDYFIVDEFQDTNHVQIEFLIKMVRDGNLTVVGDINQSIYQFRGAYSENIRMLKDRLRIEDKDVTKLDKSHRSKNRVLSQAHKIIVNNYRDPSECFEVLNAKNEEGEKIKIYEMANAKEEARKIVELVREEVASGKSLSDICVIYRTHEQGRLIKKALEISSIEHKSVSKKSLLKDHKIREIIDYLRVVKSLIRKENCAHDSWWRIIHSAGYSEDGMSKIFAYLRENREALDVSLLNNLSTISENAEDKIVSEAILGKIKILIPEYNSGIKEIVEKCFSFYGLDGEDSNMDMVPNLSRFNEFIKNYEKKNNRSDVDGFLIYLDVLEALEIGVESSSQVTEGVNMMTAHSTKGLEYKTVIITNFVEKRFPIDRERKEGLLPLEFLENKNFENKDNDQILEERRLCYVSFTRAKDKLIITYAREYSDRKFKPSRFLEEMNYKNNPEVDFVVDTLETDFKIDRKPDEKIRSFPVKLQRSFSPSALITFDKCQKKFEYIYVYNMPDQKTSNLESMKIGSFLHLVAQKGVESNFKKLEEFLALAKNLLMADEWKSIKFEDVEFLIKIFFERNKDKYSEKSLTEQPLSMKLGELNFYGVADRIDFLRDGLRIVDYKTGAQIIGAKERNWQLGYYALAAEKFGRVKNITLDLLKHEKPIEFEVDDESNAVAIGSPRTNFNLKDVKREIIEISRKIISAYKEGFKPCSIEDNCEFCNEHIYS